MQTIHIFPNRRKAILARATSQGFAVAVLVALVGICGDLAIGQAPAPNTDAPGAQVLTRGPVHEAFAGMITFNPEPGVVVTKAPPDVIEEMPPEERPAGDNVTWIPGYWGWDDERSDFLWVSGMWRALPPGRAWMAGYWGANGARLSMDFRLLGGCRRQRNNVSPAAARDGGSGPEHRRAFRGLRMVARMLAVVSRALRLASGVLGARAGGLELDARPLCVDSAWVHLCRRLLGLPPWSTVEYSLRRSILKQACMPIAVTSTRPPSCSI